MSLGSGELLRHVLGLLSADAFVVDAAGRFCSSTETDDANAPRCDIFDRYGVTAEARAAIDRVLSGAEPEVCFSIERDACCLEIRLRALREADGLVGAVGTAAVVTEQARLERALAASKGRLEQVLGCNIPMFFWERSGAVTAANDALLGLLGYTRDELAAGKLDWRALTPAEYWSADEASLSEIDRGTLVPPLEKEYLHKDGHRIPVLIGGTTFDPSHSSGVTFVIDESARKQQEQLRRNAEAQLRHAVNCTPFVLWAVDSRGVFTLSEGRALEALGLRPGEVLGKSAFDVYADAPQVTDALRVALAGGEFDRIVEIAGRLFETRTFPLTDAAGQLTGLVGMSLDITERQRAEAERMRLQAKLLEVQRLESLGLMAGGIAHDFNNILTVILGNASTARVALAEHDEARSDIDNIIAAGQRAAELTRQMLAYSGRGRFDVRPIDLSGLVRDISGLIGTTLSRKVQVTTELSAVSTVRADPAQLQQVIMNIVVNGVEACGDQPGTVQIRTRELIVEAGDPLIDAGLQPGRHVCLDVRDDGCGMDAATTAKIFDPFFTTKFTGRGLGLAAVVGIVRAHDGAIDVESTPGKGSRFRVFLPISDEPAAASMRASRLYRGQGLVLVIDDDASVRQIVAKMLTSIGFSVIDAASGRLGLRALEQRAREIALVLLDMTMPEMDGEETLRAIRKLSPVPVVLMSGYGESEAMLRFSSQRLAGFLQKPFTAQQLGDVSSQALEPSLAGRAVSNTGT
jgi:two-component system, cell cycle sensor histidine kinase and response regulator CckA